MALYRVGARFMGEPSHKTVLQIYFQRFMHGIIPQAFQGEESSQAMSERGATYQTSRYFCHVPLRKETADRHWRVAQGLSARCLAPFAPSAPNWRFLTCHLFESSFKSLLVSCFRDSLYHFNLRDSMGIFPNGRNQEHEPTMHPYFSRTGESLPRCLNYARVCPQ